MASCRLRPWLAGAAIKYRGCHSRRHRIVVNGIFPSAGFQLLLSAKRDEQVKVTGQIADNVATIYGKVVDSVSEGLEIADAEIEAAAKTLLLVDRPS